MQSGFSKKILFAGMPDMGLVCLAKLMQSGIRPVALIPPPKDDSTYSLFMQWAEFYGLPVIGFEKNLQDPVFLEKISELDADIGITASYSKKFPPELLNSVKDGFLNVHPSLLPDYRGGNPYSNVIINNEKQTGVTIHFMDENFDTGDIVFQKKLKINDYETMGTLFNRSNELAAQMITEVLNAYNSGKTLPRKKQPEGVFKKAPSLKNFTNDVLIDWTKPAPEIERFIKALNPFINAATYYKGHYVKIFTATPFNKTSKLAPGEIFTEKNELFAACGKGILKIDTMSLGSMFTGGSRDFLRLFKIKRGDKFDYGQT